MSDSAKVQQVVDRAVSEVLEAALPELRARLATRLQEELSALAPAPPPPEAAAAGDVPLTDLLYSAFASVQDATSQTDILSALLDGTSSFSGRSALIVVKKDTAKVWRSRGFTGAVQNLNIDLGQPLPGRVMQHREPAAAAAADMGGDFVEAVGNPADGNATLLPLLVRGKVAALLYADGGDGSVRLDTSALQLLVRSTGTWLELASARKEAPADEHEAAEEAVPAPPEPAEQPAAAEEPAPVAEAAPAEEPAPEPASAAPEPAPAPPPAADSEVHRKARRFAKLLVDEIKLYNKDKVAKGRENRDLYDRLREDIEKSRASYDKRFGKSEAASADYFNQELIRVLADNDVTLLGSSFQS
jgi:hypothetical protein